MFGDPEYYAKQQAVNQWLLAKFEGSSEPTAIYTLLRLKGKWLCDCQGFRSHGHCKHPSMIEDFINRKKEIEL